MRVAVIGRSRMLLGAAEKLRTAGHEIPIVRTAKAQDYYGVSEGAFGEFAESIGADFAVGSNLDGEEQLGALAAAGCDVAISVNWPVMIQDSIMALFPHGVLNFHAGDLPRYRGNAAPNWAILNGEAYVGLCVHRMAAGGFDTGPILCRSRIPLSEETYIGDVYEALDRLAPELFVEAVDGLSNRTATFETQPDDAAHSLRCYPRRPEDARIIWTQPADQVRRLIRASSRPFDGAFAYLEAAARVTVWRAETFEHPGPFCAVPGQVLFAVDGDPVVACGESALRLTDVHDADGADARTAITRSFRNRLT